MWYDLSIKLRRCRNARMGNNRPDFEDLVTVNLDRANKYLFGTWLPQHNLTTEPFSVEKYFQNTEDMVYMEIWVKLLVSETGGNQK